MTTSLNGHNLILRIQFCFSPTINSKIMALYEGSQSWNAKSNDYLFYSKKDTIGSKKISKCEFDPIFIDTMYC